MTRTEFDIWSGKTEHTEILDQTTVPDYELDDYLIVDRPDQHKAVASNTRRSILGLLNQRAASTSGLADALRKPKGTIGHHLKVLADASLIRVVRTRRVRALTEKFYGRTARTFVFKRLEDSDLGRLFMVRTTLEEAVDSEDAPPAFTQRYAQISPDRARAFFERLAQLAEEFASQPPEGDAMFGLLAGVYPTARSITSPDADD